MPTRKNDKRPKVGMPERTLAFCILREHATNAERQGAVCVEIENATTNAIIDCRACGMPERDVIRHARHYVAQWFKSGLIPKSFVAPAVRMLAHIDSEYPIQGKARFIGIMNRVGYPREIAADMIADAVRGGLIQARRTKDGVEYRLAHEPQTHAVCDLLEHVAAMMPRHPFGIPFRRLCGAAGLIAGGGMMRGTVLIERALNAGVIRAEVRGEGWRRERYIFPNFKTKGK